MTSLILYKKNMAATTSIPLKKESVYSTTRVIKPHITPAQSIVKDSSIIVNGKNVMNGLTLLTQINPEVITACFFDPQYRGIMDKMNYGNEGERQKGRALLEQMSDETIINFIKGIDRVLVKSGHLFLWIDKFHLCEGTSNWFKDTQLSVVDLITWDKGKIGMGYRTRRKSEYLLVLQKMPLRAKGVWARHDIPDVWTEKISGKIHPHQKPIGLQRALIESVTSKNEYVLDPCAGSYSVMDASKSIERNFIGCDINNI